MKVEPLLCQQQCCALCSLPEHLQRRAACLQSSLCCTGNQVSLSLICNVHPIIANYIHQLADKYIYIYIYIYNDKFYKIKKTNTTLLPNNFILVNLSHFRWMAFHINHLKKKQRGKISLIITIDLSLLLQSYL
jgi:hypothetical protein